MTYSTKQLYKIAVAACKKAAAHNDTNWVKYLDPQFQPDSQQLLLLDALDTYDRKPEDIIQYYIDNPDLNSFTNNSFTRSPTGANNTTSHNSSPQATNTNSNHAHDDITIDSSEHNGVSKVIDLFKKNDKVWWPKSKRGYFLNSGVVVGKQYGSNKQILIIKKDDGGNFVNIDLTTTKVYTSKPSKLTLMKNAILGESVNSFLTSYKDSK